MTILTRLTVAAALAAPVPALALEALGSPEQAVTLAEALAAIAEAEGLEAARAAVYDPELPFARSPMGVNLFDGAVLVADNREPEMVATDYSTETDLDGDLLWPKIEAALAAGVEAILPWYHYDTGAVYDYRCLPRRAETVDITVVVCR